MSTPQERISARMKTQRQLIGLSQEAVARRLDTTMRTYARWERGETFGYLQKLPEIAKALETTEEALLGGEDITTAQPTVAELTAKLDQVLGELAQMREDISPLVTKPRARSRH